MSDVLRTMFVQEASQALDAAFGHASRAGCCILEAADGPKDSARADRFLDALSKVYDKIDEASTELEAFANGTERSSLGSEPHEPGGH